MTKPEASNPANNAENESTAQRQAPRDDSRAEMERQNWPGKSEPGHIRPIGPAYRSGENQSGPIAPGTPDGTGKDSAGKESTGNSENTRRSA